MSEVVVVGSFKAQPGKEAEATEAFKALVDPTHREAGCILYALHQGVDDPSRLAFVERWESRELLDAHLESEHVAKVLQRQRRHRGLRAPQGWREEEGLPRRTRRGLTGAADG
jgi:quinol monooxygenase YgiN